MVWNKRVGKHGVEIESWKTWYGIRELESMVWK
jgi:hypothetical protein